MKNVVFLLLLVVSHVTFAMQGNRLSVRHDQRANTITAQLCRDFPTHTVTAQVVKKTTNSFCLSIIDPLFFKDEKEKYKILTILNDEIQNFENSLMNEVK